MVFLRYWIFAVIAGRVRVKVRVPCRLSVRSADSARAKVRDRPEGVGVPACIVSGAVFTMPDNTYLGIFSGAVLTWPDYAHACAQSTVRCLPCQIVHTLAYSAVRC